MLSYKRSTRVAELLQQELSRILLELDEPNLGFVTITGVKLTDDLQQARVFYSVIGSDEDVKRSGDIMKERTPYFRHEIARRINLRRTPTLTFEYDTTPERASRIFTILEKLKTEEEHGTAPQNAEPPSAEPAEKPPKTKPKTKRKGAAKKAR